MDDYAALLERVCFTLPKVMGSVLLSDDGLVLSAYPDDGNSVAEAAWLHFSALDEPLRGFLTFPHQVWAYVRHGAYAVFVVAEKGVRAGVLLDQLEQALTAAHVTAPAQAPPQRPPTPIGIEAPPARPPSPPAIAPPEAEEPPTPLPEPVSEEATEPTSATGSAPEPGADADAEPQAEEAHVNGALRPVRPVEGSEDDEAEIDRVQLAQEFSGLLQMHRADDEASS